MPDLRLAISSPSDALLVLLRLQLLDCISFCGTWSVPCHTRHSQVRKRLSPVVLVIVVLAAATAMARLRPASLNETLPPEALLQRDGLLLPGLAYTLVFHVVDLVE